jgi:hypothetical protein
MKSLITTLILFQMATTLSIGQIPEKWAQYTLEDTIDVPIEKYWELFFHLNLEEIGSVGDYEDLPKIAKTTPIQGDFSKLGDSRRVIFDNGQSVLETIILFDQPNNFGYELTEVKIDLRKVAKLARGHFKYEKLSKEKTKISWTYGFEQKNFLFKWVINSYIKRTHRFWMKDTLTEMKRQIVEMYKAEMK